MRFDFHHRFLAVECDIDQKIFVRQNPLQRGSELPIIVDDENGFQLKTVDERFKRLRVRVEFSHAAGAPCLSRRSAKVSRRRDRPVRSDFETTLVLLPKLEPAGAFRWRLVLRPAAGLKNCRPQARR